MTGQRKGLRTAAWIGGLTLLFLGLFLRIKVAADTPGMGTGAGIGFAIGMVFIALLLAAVLSVLLAVWPAGGRSFGARWRRRVPYAILAACALAVLLALLPEWYTDQHAMEPVDAAVYDNTPEAAEGCGTIHDGVFGNAGIRIERRGGEQYQLDKVLGQEEQLRVTWLTPCVYELRGEDSTSVRHVKVTHVDSAGYDCIVRYAFDTTYAFRMRLERER